MSIVDNIMHIYDFTTNTLLWAECLLFRAFSTIQMFTTSPKHLDECFGRFGAFREEPCGIGDSPKHLWTHVHWRNRISTSMMKQTSFSSEQKFNKLVNLCFRPHFQSSHTNFTIRSGFRHPNRPKAEIRCLAGIDQKRIKKKNIINHFHCLRMNGMERFEKEAACSDHIAMKSACSCSDRIDESTVRSAKWH